MLFIKLNLKQLFSSCLSWKFVTSILGLKKHLKFLCVSLCPLIESIAVLLFSINTVLNNILHLKGKKTAKSLRIWHIKHLRRNHKHFSFRKFKHFAFETLISLRFVSKTEVPKNVTWFFPALSGLGSLNQVLKCKIKYWNNFGQNGHQSNFRHSR